MAFVTHSIGNVGLASTKSDGSGHFNLVKGSVSLLENRPPARIETANCVKIRKRIILGLCGKTMRMWRRNVLYDALKANPFDKNTRIATTIKPSASELNLQFA